jgi:mannosyl-oligosaccharide glucosidase
MYLSADHQAGQLYSEVYNETMEWGTYKPNLFFGIKNRSPKPLTLGLVWAVPGSQGQMNIRHTYRYQSGDGVTAYYEYHDGWGSSREIIEDPLANARFEIDFVKLVSYNDGEDKALKSQWKVLMTIKPIRSEQKMTLMPFLYLTQEDGQLQIQ